MPWIRVSQAWLLQATRLKPPRSSHQLRQQNPGEGSEADLGACQEWDTLDTACDSARLARDGKVQRLSLSAGLVGGATWAVQQCRKALLLFSGDKKSPLNRCAETLALQDTDRSTDLIWSMTLAVSCPPPHCAVHVFQRTITLVFYKIHCSWEARKPPRSLPPLLGAPINSVCLWFLPTDRASLLAVMLNRACPVITPFRLLIGTSTYSLPSPHHWQGLALQCSCSNPAWVCKGRDVTCCLLLQDGDFPVRTLMAVAEGGKQEREGALPEKQMTMSVNVLCSLCCNWRQQLLRLVWPQSHPNPPLMTSQCIAVETMMISQHHYNNIWLHSREGRQGTTQAGSNTVLFER